MDAQMNVKYERILSIKNIFKNLTSDKYWHAVSIIIFTIIGIVMFKTFQDYGTIWDEEVQFVYGEYILSWFRTMFQDHSALNYFDLVYYGGLFDVIANIGVRVLPFGLYESRHLVNAGFAILGLYATWRLGRIVDGYLTGLIAVLLLVLTPVYYGHSFNNPKDIPFASLAALTLYYIFLSARSLPKLPVALCVKTGLALGATLGIRVGGVFLIGYMVIFWAIRLLLDRTGQPVRQRITILISRATVVLLAAWPIMILSWPWAQQAPFTRPFEAFAAATHFRWEGKMLFRGEMISSLRVPWSYLPTWFLITLPEAYFVVFVLAGFLLARILLKKEKPTRSGLLDASALTFTILFPFLAVVLLKSVLYDAHRQFLFVLPPLAVLTAWCLVTFLHHQRVHPVMRWLSGLLVAASLLLTIVDMTRLHPYQTLFFNRLFGGGLENAANRYETDYWGASYREGIETLIQHYRPDSVTPVKVANCAANFQTEYWLSRNPEAHLRFISVKPTDDPDILIATKRYRCMADPGRIIHIVEREGVLILAIFERHPRGVWIDADGK
jgi:4-amino-4-deoxy-L-arabinose transferase-like glycosyltransferase